MRQAALPFVHEPAYDPGAFVNDASNEEARAWLGAEWPSGRLALWGAAGSGKTHLLNVWAASCSATILFGPQLAIGLPGSGAIALDDADRSDERALFHLLNSAAEAGSRVLLAARHAPSRWPTRLPDLASRLRALPAVELAPPGDDMLRTLFASLLAQRQLAVAEPLQRWLMLRLPRDPAALREAAARLDAATLETGRSVTQAVVAQIAIEIAEAASAP